MRTRKLWMVEALNRLRHELEAAHELALNQVRMDQRDLGCSPCGRVLGAEHRRDRAVTQLFHQPETRHGVWSPGRDLDVVYQGGAGPSGGVPAHQSLDLGPQLRVVAALLLEEGRLVGGLQSRHGEVDVAGAVEEVAVHRLHDNR